MIVTFVFIVPFLPFAKREIQDSYKIPHPSNPSLRNFTDKFNNGFPLGNSLSSLVAEVFINYFKIQFHNLLVTAHFAIWRRYVYDVCNPQGVNIFLQNKSALSIITNLFIEPHSSHYFLSFDIFRELLSFSGTTIHDESFHPITMICTLTRIPLNLQPQQRNSHYQTPWGN